MLYSVNCLTMTQNNGPYVMLETSVPFKKVAVTFKLEEKYIEEKKMHFFFGLTLFLPSFCEKGRRMEIGRHNKIIRMQPVRSFVQGAFV